jgi:hypothetical protein
MLLLLCYKLLRDYFLQVYFTFNYVNMFTSKRQVLSAGFIQTFNKLIFIVQVLVFDKETLNLIVNYHVLRQNLKASLEKLFDISS